ncbi:MAG: hypothetical protein AB7G75_28875 [Candidatus Binatia bacterium]
MNKQTELIIVESLLRTMPSATVVEIDREGPDFLIQIGAEIIGVEVTTVIESRSRQRIVPQEWVVRATGAVNAAQAVFEAQHSVGLVVRFELSASWKPPKRDTAARFANELASIAADVYTKHLAEGRSTEPVTLRDPHPSVSWAYFASSRGSAGHWAPLFLQSVQSASDEDIRETVAKKEPRVKDYRNAAERVWLLIDCDLSGQGISLDVPKADFVVHTNFDRVFCCRFGLWQWVEIPVVKPWRESHLGFTSYRQQCKGPG